MKQRILKSWLLFSALYSIVSTVFIFLFRKWFNFDHLEEISFQETHIISFNTSIFIIDFCGYLICIKSSG